MEARKKKVEDPQSDEQRDGEGVSTLEGTIGVILGAALDVRLQISLDDLAPNETLKKKQERIREKLVGGILIVDARLAGLEAGLLDEKCNLTPRTADDGQHDWMGSSIPIVGFRVEEVEEPSHDPNLEWRERFRFAKRLDAPLWLVVRKWRDEAATEEDRSEGHEQALDEHEEWTAERARTVGGKLNLPTEYVAMLELAARLHDEGKRASRWQRAFNAPRGSTVYAKTQGPVNTSLLDGYRHELGSVLSASVRERLQALREDLRELATHLIVAHHGFARPIIETRGCDVPPSLIEHEASETALRFARLQQEWGPWGLAWWESLLRAADQQASRANDQRGKEGWQR